MGVLDPLRTKGRAACAAAVLLVLAAACPGCETRAYDNPLDPRNPATRGEAPGFNAVAGAGEVALVWSALGIGDLEDVRILRWVEDQAAETLAVFPPEITSWVDLNVSTGVTYAYRARLGIRGDRTVHLSNPDQATPGPERVWVVDESWGGLHAVAPDGRDLKWKAPYAGYLRSVAVDEVRALVWAAGRWTDEVIAIDSAGSVSVVFPVEAPRRMAVDPADGGLWIAADWGVGRYTATGGVTFEDRTVSNPKDVAWDPARGACWVAEGTGSVWLRNSDGTTERVSGFDYPFALSIESASGAAWLLDAGAGRVYRLAAGGEGIEGYAAGFAQPVDVAAALPGEAWVADWDAGSVVLIGPGMERVRTISGLDRPRAVAVADSGETLWVVEAYGGRVVKFTHEGERLGWSGGLDFPKDVAVDPGTLAAGPGSQLEIVP